MRLAVIGLGKLGLPFAEALADRHDVSGFDIEPRESAAVRVAASLEDAVRGAPLVFVVLPTPHDLLYDGSRPTTHLPARDFDYGPVSAALADVDAVAEPGSSIALVSTVLPGTMRREFAPLVTRHELLHTPAFMAMGCVAEDFREAEFRLLGSADGHSDAGAAVQEVYRSFGDVPVHRLTWEEAEAVKVFYNVFISFKISLANTIQDLAQRLGHLDSDRVTTALLDGRRRLFSPMYFKPGMGDGGPCHPRDLIALRHLAERHGLGYDVFGAVAEAREGQARNLAAFLAGFGLPVLLTSRTFKPGVPYEDGSSALLVAHYLVEQGVTVRFLEDLGSPPSEPHAILMVHDVAHDGLGLPTGSVIVNPWRRCPPQAGVTVVHYGNTRT